MAVTELTSLLNTIPLDVAFVYAEDKVRYFSLGRERIFARNRSIRPREHLVFSSFHNVPILNKNSSRILDSRKSMIQKALLKFFRRAFTFSNCIVLIGMIHLLTTQSHQFADDPGVGWHLKTGEWILNNFSIPFFDPFLAYTHSRPWVSDQWLSDLIFFLFYKTGGFPLIYVCLSILYCLTFLVLLSNFLSKTTKISMLSTFTALYAFKIAQIHFILRPVLFSFVFFVLTYATCSLLYLSSKKDEPLKAFLTRHKLKIFCLPLFFLIWANIHPGFVLGLVVVGCLATSVLFDRMSNNGTLGKFMLFLILFLSCAGITIVNPYRTRLHQTIFELGTSDFFMHFHQEWFPPNLFSIEGKLFLFAVFSVSLISLLSKRVRGRIGIFHLLLFLIFGFLALDRVRILPFFGIAASIPLTIALGRLLRVLPLFKNRLGHGLRRMILNLERIDKKGFSSITLVSLFCIFILFWYLFDKSLFLYKDSYGPANALYPYKAMATLSPHAPAKIFNPPSWGGFISLYGYPNFQPVIDDRNILIGEKFYMDFFRALEDPNLLHERLCSLKATHVLFEKGTPANRIFQQSNDLKLIYEDKVSILYLVKNKCDSL